MSFLQKVIHCLITHNDTHLRHLLAYFCKIKKWSLNESVNESERIILVNELKMNESPK